MSELVLTSEKILPPNGGIICRRDSLWRTVSKRHPPPPHTLSLKFLSITNYIIVSIWS